MSRAALKLGSGGQVQPPARVNTITPWTERPTNRQYRPGPGCFQSAQYGYGDSCPTGEDGALNNGACSTGCWTWQVCRQSSRIQRPGLPECSAASRVSCSVPVSGTTEIGLSATAITLPARERSGRSSPMGGGPSDPPARGVGEVMAEPGGGQGGHPVQGLGFLEQVARAGDDLEGAGAA